MGFDGSGNVVRTNGVHTGATCWQQDSDAGTPITASRFDTHDQDLADAIENCVARDGQNAATAHLPMGGHRHTNVAEAAARTDYARASQVQDSALQWGGTAGGSANALTCSLSPAITAYTAGLRIAVIAAADNTGSATINVNGVGANTIKKIADASTTLSNLEQADITQNMTMDLLYNGSNFVLMNPSITKWVSYTPTLGAGGSMTFGTTTIHYAKYFRQGSKVWVAVDFEGTTGGTPSATLTFALPATAAASNFGGGAQVTDGTGVGGYFSFSSTTTVGVSRYDSANFGTGSGRRVRCQFVYEAA